MLQLTKVQQQDNRINFLQKKLDKLKAREELHDLLFTCVCGAYEFGHSEYNKDCKEFVPTPFDITINLTELDIFEFENPNHSERDSFSYFNEFSSWRTIRNASTKF